VNSPRGSPTRTTLPGTMPPSCSQRETAPSSVMAMLSGRVGGEAMV
jgi:hypothetical protein